MFFDIYAELCKRKGKKPSAVAEELGINKSNVSNWKNNGYTPRGEVLYRIANYFGVTVSYLLGDTTEITAIADSASSKDSALPGLAPDEQQLLTGYRNLNQQGKEYILQTVAMASRVYIKPDCASNMEKQTG